MTRPLAGPVLTNLVLKTKGSTSRPLVTAHSSKPLYQKPNVADLRPLRGARILTAESTPVESIEGVVSDALVQLRLNNTHLKTLEPLAECEQLQVLAVSNTHINFLKTTCR